MVAKLETIHTKISNARRRMHFAYIFRKRKLFIQPFYPLKPILKKVKILKDTSNRSFRNLPPAFLDLRVTNYSFIKESTNKKSQFLFINYIEK